MAWYNIYRPKSFDDVLGQDLVVQILKKAVEAKKIKQAYLFSGTRGVGKTTIARIFARAIIGASPDDMNPLDIAELDGATNNGVDFVRELKESFDQAPLNGSYKVYIIDEVHMFTPQAFSALLKVMEEPPVHLILIMATTHPDKLLPTVRSRLTHFKLYPHSIKDLTTNLKKIAKEQKINITEDGLEYIAHLGRGSQRDAITLFETIASNDLEQYNEGLIRELVGATPAIIVDTTIKWLTSIIKGNEDTSLQQSLKEFAIKSSVTPKEYYNNLLEELLRFGFEGDIHINNIIKQTLPVFDSNLPIDTLFGAISLLRSHLIEGESSVEKKTKPDPPEPIKPIEPDEYNNIPPKSANKIAQKSKVSNQKPNNRAKDSINIDETLSSIKQSKDAPMALRMINYLKGDIDNNIINLRINTQTWVSILNAPNIQKWLIEMIKLTAGVEGDMRMNIEVEDQKQTEKVKVVKEEQNDLTETAVPSTDIELKKEDKIFYKIYSKLPPNMEDKGVQVINKIHAPIGSVVSSNDVDNYFEFD
jgi:DNA polymerase III subunit gamma/tau